LQWGQTPKTVTAADNQTAGHRAASAALTPSPCPFPRLGARPHTADTSPLSSSAALLGTSAGSMEGDRMDRGFDGARQPSFRYLQAARLRTAPVGLLLTDSQLAREQVPLICPAIHCPYLQGEQGHHRPGFPWATACIVIQAADRRRPAATPRENHGSVRTDTLIHGPRLPRQLSRRRRW
jgi:hypothetical protein